MQFLEARLRFVNHHWRRFRWSSDPLALVRKKRPARVLERIAPANNAWAWPGNAERQSATRRGRR